MKTLNISEMEMAQGGCFGLGVALGLLVVLILDDDFRQGLADGIVG